MLDVRRFLVPAAIALVCGLHLATLRGGHEWGDDFSLYVAHARNLAEGSPYADTGYVYNPHYPHLSPRSYPPIFPVLLAPVYAVFGLDLQAMKVASVLTFGAFLGVLALVLGRRLPTPYVVACLLVVGLNPFVWQHKDRLLSEFPFLLFAYLSLYLMERAYDPPGRLRPWAWGALAGLTAYLAFGTRTVGIVLVPALFAYELYRFRRLGAVALAAGGAFAVGLAAQKLLLVVDGSYADQLVVDPFLYARNAYALAKGVGLFFENGHVTVAAQALFLLLVVLAAVGFLARLRERMTPCEPFVVLSFLVLMVWPFAERRFLLTVLPLFVLYACEGLRQVGRALPARSEGVAAAVLSVAILVSYAGTYARLERGPFREGVTAPESAALFEFIREETQPDAVFYFYKPRALALYTGRRASGLHVLPSDEQLWGYLRQIGATHVVAAPQFPGSCKVLGPFVRRQADRLEPVYRSEAFTVYRVREPALASR